MRRIKVSPTDEDLRPTEFVLQLGLTKKKLRKNMTKIKERKKKHQDGPCTNFHIAGRRLRFRFNFPP